MSTGVKVSSVGASVDETLVAKPTLEVVVAQDFVSICTPVASVVTSEIRKLMVQLAPIFLEGTSVPPSSSESAPTTVMETKSASASAKPTPVMNILEGLIIDMVNQFFSMMKYCTELVLSRRNSFKFMQSLLKNHVENIRKVRGSD